MESLFGVPMDDVMAWTGAATLIVVLVVSLLALRRRTFFKLAMRNIPRRPAQTGLIVMGLMLSTLLITSAFGTGDTMTYNIKLAALSGLGGTDIRITRQGGASPFGDMFAQLGGPQYFTATISSDLRQKLAGYDKIDGWTTAVDETVPVINPTTQQGTPQTNIIGVEAGFDAVYGLAHTRQGPAFRAANLGPGDIVLDANAADQLAAQVGQTVQVFVQGKATSFTVRGVIDYASPAFASPVGMIRLDAAQALFGHPGQITSINISLLGDTVGGARYSDEATTRIKALIAPGFDVSPVKAVTLEQANQAGNIFSTIFVGFSLFSIAAGILLIFLIFVMLAAERKSEMGMARAVGAQRSDLTQMFVFEGLAYDLGAAAVGAALGVGVGWVMVVVINGILGQYGFTLVRHIEPRSLVVAYCLGMLITFITVALSAARVSALNIVSAIRDTPEPVKAGAGVRGALRTLVSRTRDGLRDLAQGRLGAAFGSLVVGVPLALVGLLWALLITGLLTTAVGAGLIAWAVLPNQTDSLYAFLFSLGASVTILGVGLLLRWLMGLVHISPETRDRIAFSLIGIGLIVYWALPLGTFHDVFGVPTYKLGVEWFFLAGLMMVAGATWTVVYNGQTLLGGLTALLGRVSRLTPILKTAVAYPLNYKFRTGLTVAMFALILFTLTMMAVLVYVSDQTNLIGPETTGGYDLRAAVSFTNPVPDLAASVAAQPALAGKFSVIGGQTVAPVELRQPGVAPPTPAPNTTPLATDPAWQQGWRPYVGRLADAAFLTSTQYHLMIRAQGYADDQAVWAALAHDPSLVVVDPLLVPNTNAGASGFRARLLQLQGVHTGDASMAPIPIQIRAFGQAVQTVTVIGVLSWQTNDPGIYGNRALLSHLTLLPIPVTTYYFKLAPGADPQTIRRALGSAFLQNGLEPVVILDELHAQAVIGQGLVGLLEGFMALGLLVGIAALGVISTRAVVERRQQIGVLRAIGYQRGMVQLSFLLESAFVVLLGSVLGVGLGLILSYNLTMFFSAQALRGTLTFQVPWLTLGGIVLLAYMASLLTTVLPAYQASRVYPAEALRYE